MERKLLRPVQRLWREAWTTVWGYTKVAAGGLIILIHYVGNLAINPGVKEALDKLALPVYIGLGLAILGAVTLMSVEHKDASDNSE